MDYYSESNRDANVTYYSPIDYYPESNVGPFLAVGNGTLAAGQSITGNGEKLRSARFYIKKTGSPTGNITAKLYAHTGTFGVSSQGTGSALATSDPIDITTLTTTAGLQAFNFDGTYRLVNGVNYVIVVEYTNGDTNNNLQAGYDSSSPTHAGNLSTRRSSIWVDDHTVDLIFYVNGLETSYGQSFVGDGASISKAKFYINKTGAPTGNIFAKIHSHSGTYGTSGKPTGAALATSDNVNVATLPTSQALIDFPFSTPFPTVNGTQYVVTLHFTPLNPTDTVNVGCDSSTPSASGNSSVFDNSRWFGDSDKDLVFYVME